MKILIVAMLVSLVAMVNGQSGDPDECFDEFFAAPENLLTLIEIGQNCADVLDLENTVRIRWTWVGFYTAWLQCAFLLQTEEEIESVFCTDMETACSSSFTAIFDACNIDIEAGESHWAVFALYQYIYYKYIFII